MSQTIKDKLKDYDGSNYPPDYISPILPLEDSSTANHCAEHDPHNHEWYGSTFYIITKDKIDDDELDERVARQLLQAMTELGIVAAVVSDNFNTGIIHGIT